MVNLLLYLSQGHKGFHHSEHGGMKLVSRDDQLPGLVRRNDSLHFANLKGIRYYRSGHYTGLDGSLSSTNGVYWSSWRGLAVLLS